MSGDPDTDLIRDAATWLATGGRDKNRAVVPQLREHFKLTPKDACAAIRVASLIRARSY